MPVYVQRILCYFGWDGMECRAGSISSDFNRYMAWKSADGSTEASRFAPQLETLVKGMLNPATLLDLVRNFIVFEKSKKEDPETGITQVETVKKLAAYHQYYAVNKAVENTLKAASADGSRKGGVVWHTQGSGKSISMVFYTGKLVLSLNNPTVVVITDRNDLDDQLFDTFASSKQLLRQEPVQAKDRGHLKELLKVASGGIVFTTIQKFLPDDGKAEYDRLSDRNNIVVIADEAHRTQYGFEAKFLDVKDKDTKEVTGKRIAYGFAKYMRDALPNATYIGFTGMPIESTDINTPAVFGQYVDIYDIAQYPAPMDRLCRSITPPRRSAGNYQIEWKEPADPLKLVIVRDMWLTGFDAPCLHTLYVDKPMRGHTLEAIMVAEPAAYYGSYPGTGFNYRRFFPASPKEKLSIILQAEEHILGLKEGKNRFIAEVMLLSKAFALSIPHGEALAIKDEVALFQAVKARLVKFTGDGTGRPDRDIETAIRQIVDEALSSDRVIDIFDAAGIKKPEISILSEEFLLEIKGMKHQNLALELLKKILNDEIRGRSKTNLVKSKALLEMLETALKKYQNNLLSTAEIIQELIGIAKEIKEADQRGVKLGMSEEELAFYDALEVNDSAVHVLGDEQLRLIAREIAEKVKANATIDWTIRESARAKLMVLVKRTLNKYGYPPDKQQKAIDTVLKQAELLADNLVGRG